MKSIILMAGSILLTSVAIAEEVPDAVSGQKLFSESRCLECHGVELFTSVDRKVKNLTGLESMVRRCDANLSTNWFDDQILDVVEYLNTTYYKFDKNIEKSETGAGLSISDAEAEPVVSSNQDD